MKPISKTEWKKAAAKQPYLNGRWVYSKKVIDFVIESKCASCLEIGPAFQPLFHDSDIMDYQQMCAREISFLRDCCSTPWPVEDKTYDVVIAMQVWEHLAKPNQAFQEIRRVSRRAVLGLPYKWTRKSNHSPCHWHIDEKKIFQWTGLEPCRTEVLSFRSVKGRKKKWPCIICFYDNIP